MTPGTWQQWGKKPEVEETLLSRARGVLPEMESTKQLVELVSAVYEPGMRVLDVGCNVGHYLRGLRRLDRDLKYTGVDAYEHYVLQAREVFGDDANARFEIRDIHEPLFADDPFDIVFCCNVILHLPDFRTPVRNLLESAKGVCFIRTLLGDRTTIVKAVDEQDFDVEGNPSDYAYQNTWHSGYVTEFIEELGWRAHLVRDEYDPEVLGREFEAVKKGQGTAIVDGRQVRSNIIFNWTWVKITRP